MRHPDRVLLVGDLHGNTRWVLTHVFKTAVQVRADRIVQLGDMGVWHGAEGERYLDAIDSASGRHRIPFDFIDGNHEAFDLLLATPLAPDGRRPVRTHVHHLPRGYRWVWHGRTYLALGGAVSIDLDHRIPFVSWWPHESITAGDVGVCIAGGSVDVMLTHDAPLDVSFNGFALTSSIETMAYASRMRLQAVIDACHPDLLVHGHWHQNHVTTAARDDGGLYTVIGLQADGGASPLGVGHCALLDAVAGTVSVVD